VTRGPKTRARTTLCKRCGKEPLERSRTKQELLEALDQVRTLLALEAPHPVPPHVQSWEKLEDYKRAWQARYLGHVDAIVGFNLRADFDRLCWECGNKS
jgi:hypothetical protein